MLSLRLFPFINHYIISAKWLNLTQLKSSIYKLQTGCSRVASPGRVLCAIPSGILLADQTVRQAQTPSESRDGTHKVHIPNPSSLSNEYLVRQAAVVTVDSISSLLTHCVSAYSEAEREYQEAIKKLTKLLEYSLTISGNDYEEDNVWQMMIAARSEMNEKRQQAQELNHLLESVVSLAKDAITVAYVTGADFACQITSERLYSTEQHIKTIKGSSRELEDYYMSVNLKAIKETGDSDKQSKPESSNMKQS